MTATQGCIYPHTPTDSMPRIHSSRGGRRQRSGRALRASEPRPLADDCVWRLDPQKFSFGEHGCLHFAKAPPPAQVLRYRANAEMLKPVR